MVSLWAEWQHHGRLIANYGNSRYVALRSLKLDLFAPEIRGFLDFEASKHQVTLDSEKFGIISWRWAGPFYRYLQIFGVLLIGKVETLYAEDAQASASMFRSFRCEFAPDVGRFPRKKSRW